MKKAIKHYRDYLLELSEDIKFDEFDDFFEAKYFHEAKERITDPNKFGYDFNDEEEVDLYLRKIHYFIQRSLGEEIPNFKQYLREKRLSHLLES